MSWVLVLSAAFFSALISGLWLRCVRHRLVDVPGARSLHRQPTPTGGGVGVSAGMALLPLLASMSGLLVFSGMDTMPLLVSTLVLSLVGLLDDLRGLPVGLRLVLQGLCAAWVLSSLGVVPSAPHAIGVAIWALAWLWLVGFTNVFNFMDGIDGLAASQAAFVGFASAFFAMRAGGHTDLPLLLALAGGAAAGFLCWNWPPARLFMGDAGSLPLGFMLASLGLACVLRGLLSIWCLLILWAPFLCDAGVTLLSRALRGAAILRPHREHAYQRVAMAVDSHRTVTLGVIAVDLLWLLPLALLADDRPERAPIAAIVALAPLLVGIVVVALRLPADGAPVAASAGAG
jgi:Fuc2NAc and GlcNAc transferase